MQKLKEWFRKDGIGVWLLTVALMIPALAIDSSQSRLPRYLRSAAFAVIIFGISKWWKRLLAYVIIMVLSGFAWAYYGMPDHIMSEVSLTPPPNGPVVSELVILGGDEVRYSKTDGSTTHRYHATIRFFTEDGWGAAVAHPSEIPTGATVMVSGAKAGEHTEGKVVSKSDLGLVLTGLNHPSGRARMRIAQPDEIDVGAKASVHVLDDDYILTVVGFRDESGITNVVLRSPSREFPIVPGMSGSPVIQNGKIIAFLAATANFRDQYVYAPLAIDVYRAMNEVRSSASAYNALLVDELCGTD